MSNEKTPHYLGLTYVVPLEAGLASEAKAVGRRLAALLDALGDINTWVVEKGELTEKCWEFKTQLIAKLDAEGWRIRIPRDKYHVLPPLPAKKAKPSANEVLRVVLPLEDWTLESCPKCGQKVHRCEACISEGTGEEAGRTFYYCSEYCKETH
jgi:predicted RNA-binding Zn-ribbon protein involved in translation (DUF1610 family)